VEERSTVVPGIVCLSRRTQLTEKTDLMNPIDSTKRRRKIGSSGKEQVFRLRSISCENHNENANGNWVAATKKKKDHEGSGPYGL